MMYSSNHSLYLLFSKPSGLVLFSDFLWLVCSSARSATDNDQESNKEKQVVLKHTTWSSLCAAPDSINCIDQQSRSASMLFFTFTFSPICRHPFTHMRESHFPFYFFPLEPISTIAIYGTQIQINLISSFK